jgi:metallo-beta-lactamase class B
MFASLLGPALVAAAQLVIPLGHPKVIEPARAPIETSGPLWVARCNGSDDWTKPAPPVRIHGNTYLVGTCGISSILVVGDQGDVLIDGGPPEAAPLIAANIEALGFRIEDVRFILHSHEHPDQIGALAELQRMSKATIVASAASARVLQTGRPGDDDPQAGALKDVPIATVGRTIADGGEVRLGNLMLTAIATPGNAPGALSWRWISCDGGVCRTIVYADSLTPVSGPKYRFTDHPAYLAAFRGSIAKIAASPCEILLTPRPSASDLPNRLALGEPLFDANACKNYAAQLTRNLDDRVAKESAK